MKKLFSVVGASVLVMALCASTLSAAEFSPTFAISGFGQIRYNASQAGTIAGPNVNNEQISIPRARIAISGDAAENLGYKFNLDLASNPNPAFLDGVSPNTQVVDAYLDFKHIKGLTVRVGQFPNAIGLELPQSPYGLDTINYSQMVVSRSGAMNTSFRDRGIAGIIDLNPVTVTLEAINGNGGPVTGIVDNNDNKYFVGKISGSLTEGLTLSGWGLTGKEPAAPNNAKNTAFGLDLTYKIKEFKLTGEYAATKNRTAAVDTKGKEFYIAGCYNLDPMWQVVLRYDRSDPNTNVSNNEVKVTTIGINYNFAKNARFQLNYEVIGETPSVKNNQLLAQVGVKFP